jgi:hypothetical protein
MLGGELHVGLLALVLGINPMLALLSRGTASSAQGPVSRRRARHLTTSPHPRPSRIYPDRRPLTDELLPEEKVFGHQCPGTTGSEESHEAADPSSCKQIQVTHGKVDYTPPLGMPDGPIMTPVRCGSAIHHAQDIGTFKRGLTTALPTPGRWELASPPAFVTAQTHLENCHHRPSLDNAAAAETFLS